MKEYKVQEWTKIPYFNHDKKISKTIQRSSQSRGLSPLAFAWRKLRNTFLYKRAYMCPLNGWRIKMHRKRGVTIGDNVYIGMRCVLDNAYPEYLYLEDNVSLAGGVTLIAHANPYPHFQNIVESAAAPIVIKNGAWIGENVTILRGVTIGENAIVSAGTVVDKDVPACSMAKGNPMKIVTEFSALMDN